MKLGDQNSQFKSESWNGIDLLGREAFAGELTQRIRAWKDKESLVIGIFGEWGNGKTVVKDMVVKMLCSQVTNCPLILHFSPWEWSGHEQMTVALFGQIRTALGKKENGKWAKKVADAFERYQLYLETTLFGFEGIAKALAFISAIGAIPLLIGSINGSVALKVIGFTFLLITWLLPFLRFGKEFLERLSKAFSSHASRNERTLEELKEDTRQFLQKLDKPLLIVIDDVDRLSAEEIKSLFQLVKANLNFPNIIYFLLFQKDIIENALQKTFQVPCGKEYLKKIINVGIDLPKIDRQRLEKVLKNDLEKLILQNRFPIDTARLDNAFREGFGKMFKNLRDVNRYLVTFEFNLGLFSPNDALEVDCLDLALLGALKQFEEEVYQKIPNFKNALLRQGDIFKKEEKKEAEYKAAIESLTGGLSPANKDCVYDILKLLFPPSYEATRPNKLPVNCFFVNALGWRHVFEKFLGQKCLQNCFKECYVNCSTRA